MSEQKHYYMRDLCEKIHYQFNDDELLPLALTHRSAGAKNNERLEFLGDSILNFTIGAKLFELFPKTDEGQLTRMRARLVCGATLAKIANRFELGKVMLLGPGEKRTGGQQRESILSDCLEAIIGAIYLDGGIDVARQCVLQWFEQELLDIGDNIFIKDPKTVLQELLQSKHLPLPTYEIKALEGKPHKQQFVVKCTVSLLNKAVIGKGSSRRKAEQAAAAQALELLEQQ